MDIGKKVQIIIISMFSLLVLVLAVGSHGILLSSFSEFEEEKTVQDTQAIRNVIAQESFFLDSIAQEWASQEQYIQELSSQEQYIQDLAPQELVSQDLAPQELEPQERFPQGFASGSADQLSPGDFQPRPGMNKLEQFGINMILFVNNSGETVYSKTVGLNSGETGPVPEEILEKIAWEKLPVLDPEASMEGVVLLEEGPMLISAQPVLSSSDSSDSLDSSENITVEGTLILGKYLDSIFLETAGNKTDLPTYSSLSICRLDGEIPPDFAEGVSEVLSGDGNENGNENGNVNGNETDNEIVVLPLGEERIAGYFVLEDPEGNPAVVLRTDYPRDFYALGNKVFAFILVLLLLTVTVTGIAIRHGLNKFIVSRLVTIDNFLEGTQGESDSSKKLEIEGEDELSRLSSGVNEMLKNVNLSKQELKEKEHEKRVILDSLKEIVVYLDPELRVAWANRAALEYLKTELEDIVGKGHEDFSWLQSYEVLKACLTEAGETGENGVSECMGLEESTWAIEAAPVRDEAGVLAGMLLTGIEITEVRKRERELIKAKLEAEQASRAKSEFLANMSHELRTPLNSVIGFSEVLSEQIFGELNEKQLRYMGNVSRSGKHLLGLINEILDISKVETGKLKLECEDFPLPAVFEEIKAQMAPLVSEKNIIIEFRISGEISRLHVDRRRFLQVLYNLLSNAVKFSPENGLIEVEVGRRGKMLRVEVKDRGIGISKENMEKLFKPFCQLDSFYSKKYSGTGLGLALVKKIVQLHGGYVWVKSEDGKGSTFGFSLPFSEF